jgi:hypothetical protein
MGDMPVHTLSDKRTAKAGVDSNDYHATDVDLTWITTSFDTADQKVPSGLEGSR